MRLAAVDPAAARHAHRDRSRELPARSVPQSGRLRNQLIEPRIDVVGELDLDDGSQAVGTHADRGPDDSSFGDRGVEDSLASVRGLQAFGATEHSTEISDVLSEHDDVIVTSEHDLHGRAERNIHRHRRHSQSPIC